jgi:23S rRNA (adenine2030-N6)-methyltransferase
MKYRHSFHAGNFADVHKHVAVLALLRALQRKDKGLLYFDTHAGRGLYDLAGSDSHHGSEARQGIGRLRQAATVAPEIDDYLRCVASACASAGVPHGYAGSPLLAAQVLRPQDRAVCCELQPPECRALERALAGHPRMRTECGDGLRLLSAHLPPIERRALVLIDPPYEDTAAELQSALQTITVAIQRLAGAVVALWYPIKDDRTLAPWLRRVATTLAAPTLLSELWLHPRDSRVALNGSGLLIVNAPYQFDTRMAEWLPELGQWLDTERVGGTALRWIIDESA